MEYFSSDVIAGFLTIAVIINFLLIIILFTMNLSNKRKLNRLKAKYNRFMSGLSGRNIEQLIETCLDRIDGVENQIRDMEFHLRQLDDNMSIAVQKVGIVRFNAFDNVGSDLSFSIALLDSYDSGVVISGLYTRDSSTTYAKPIVNGKSKYALSAEEIQAIDIAIKKAREKQYLGN